MNQINDGWKEKFFKKYYKDITKSEFYLECKNNHLNEPLYQYTKVKYAKDLIYDNLMYLRDFKKLNDPFEGDLICDFGKNLKIENKIEELKKDKNREAEFESCIRSWFNKKIRNEWEKIKDETSIVCFSEYNNITPMWAHYSENHKGICVEYDFNKNKTLKNECFPVYYVDNGENNVLCEEIFNEKNSKNHMLSQMFLRKGKDWSYEKEWRLIILNNFDSNGSNICYKNNKKYLQFMKPTKVYLGYNIEKENEEYIKDMCYLNKIKTYKMDKDESGYNLKPKKL